MRHPAAPTVVAALLGFLIFMILWSRARSDDHHEGNPHPRDVPLKVHAVTRELEGEDDD